MIAKPKKPSLNFPLFPHASGQWAKKVKGRLQYFGPWDDPQKALARYRSTNGKAQRSISSGGKPDKPHKDFPLFAHSSGQWAKKVRGRLVYFGPWRDPEAALDRWLEDKDDLLAGRTPQHEEGVTVRDLVNRFLTSKKRLVESRELHQRTWEDYDAICKRVIEVFGRNRLVEDLRPPDFERLRSKFAKTHGPVALSNDITRTRVLFNYAFKQGLIDRPVRYGDSFEKPTRAVLRKERQKKGPRMFSAKELLRIIKAAPVQMKAMIYLGINCALGNNDCAKLTTTAVDLKKGWLEFPRPKTGIMRRCPLWPETIKAVKAAIVARPAHKEASDKNLVFITKYGWPWEPKTSRDNPISKEMAKLLKELKLHRPGLGFYALRHTFQTVAEKTRDKDAVRAIMGHAESATDMSTHYSEEPVDDSRLKAAIDFVHEWLFSKTR
ncbi:MAG: tyrosine-type recombinase/integrase [Pirellulales bacterium]|nr:tyrosine-type recombinase/integrase [Pirellulales bacterium]